MISILVFFDCSYFSSRAKVRKYMLSNLLVESTGVFIFLPFLQEGVLVLSKKDLQVRQYILYLRFES